MPLRRRIILTRRVGCSVALSYYLRRGLCLMDHSEVVFFRMVRCAVRGTIPSRGLRSQPPSSRTTVLPVATGRIRPRDNRGYQDGRPCSRRLQVLPARALSRG